MVKLGPERTPAPADPMVAGQHALRLQTRFSSP